MMVGDGGPVQASPKADVSLTADALRALRSEYDEQLFCHVPIVRRRVRHRDDDGRGATFEAHCVRLAFCRLDVPVHGEKPKSVVGWSRVGRESRGEGLRVAQKSAVQPWDLSGPFRTATLEVSVRRR